MNPVLPELLQEFARSLGVAPTAFDAHDSCAVSFDDVVVNLQLLNDGENMLIYAQIGEVPAEDELEFCRELLSANLLFRQTGGATLSLQKDSGTVVLTVILEAAGCDLIRFEAAIENFVNMAELWTERIRTFAEDPAAAEDFEMDRGIRV